MELSKLINTEQEDISGNNNDIYKVNDIRENSMIYIKLKKSHNIKDIPFVIYPTIITLLIFIIGIIIYLIFLSKYEITYIYTENAYEKPKYSSHKYSSITFENGLKVVLVQVDPDDEAGAAISYDYGYLDNQFEPGYLEFAFFSLINYDVFNSTYLTNYFGEFNQIVEKFYSSFYFQILGGGFRNYLKTFSELTYLKDNDERFNNISKNIFSNTNNKEKKSHLLEYLIYGYQNSKGEDIIPVDYNDIMENLKGNYTQIENIMRVILDDPTKIKIVIYSHYKMSYMKKLLLNYFKNIINKSKTNNNINQKIAYNISEFNKGKIIYYKLDAGENNFIEINYFLNNTNIEYNQLIKDSQYLLYITYILKQTNEGSLYYELNHGYNNISIKSLSSEYEVILKSKVKFYIKVELNHYSYNYITDIISRIYNYMNNIKLYIVDYYNSNLNDIRIEELQTISEQIFTFTEDAHESIFFKNLATDLFYKDEKDYLLKKMWFTKQNFIENINTVKFYFNQLNINNSIILIGINDESEKKYNLHESDISYLFKNIKTTKYYDLNYSLNDINKHFHISYDNNYTTLLNPKKNEFISEYNYNTDLEYNSDDYDNYFKTTHEEIGNTSDNYIKVFWKKDTSFHIPKIFILLDFFHPFWRPNFFKNSDDSGTSNYSKNDKLIFEYLLYSFYMKRIIKELLADSFRTGENYFEINFNENFLGMSIFIFSDKAKQVFDIINNIINNKNLFISELEKRFEIYRDDLLDYLLFSDYLDPLLIDYTFYEALTRDNNDFPPIYNMENFPIDSFINTTIDDFDINEIVTDVYSIKYIYIFGYYNKTDADEIYKLFKYSNSTINLKLPFTFANYTWNKINDTNFVEMTLEKPLINKSFKTTSNTEYNYTRRFMNFVGYTLKNSCLIDMLIDILTKNDNFTKYDISITRIKQSYIYIGYIFKKKAIENKIFMKNIIDWLNETNNMREPVDVIGDRFYYFLKGFKKLSSLKHYNMVDSALNIALDAIYKTIRDNDITEYNLESYNDFIEEIKKYVYSSIPYIEIVPAQ